MESCRLPSGRPRPNGGTGNGGGPIWAIFDADAVTREKWIVDKPYVDREFGFFFSGNTIAELADAISKNKYQKNPMPAQSLLETIARYNSFVDQGADPDFDKPLPSIRFKRLRFTPPGPRRVLMTAVPVCALTRASRCRTLAATSYRAFTARASPLVDSASTASPGPDVGGLIAGRNAAAERT